MVVIGIVAAVILLGFMILIKFRPSEFKISRSATISADPQAVFQVVNDLHRWGEWSPWEKVDPEMKRTFGKVTVGEGATYSWEGNHKVGEGKMTVTKSVAPEVIQIQLDFQSPMKRTNQTLFSFEPHGKNTKLTWVMSGHINFVGKVFNLMVNVDKMVGKDFEKGLHQLKSLVEEPKSHPHSHSHSNSHSNTHSKDISRA